MSRLKPVRKGYRIVAKADVNVKTEKSKNTEFL
jgi:hypothetical protein